MLETRSSKYDVAPTQHPELGAPVRLSIYKGERIYFQDYLTPEQALKLADMLDEGALKHTDGESETHDRDLGDLPF